MLTLILGFVITTLAALCAVLWHKASFRRGLLASIYGRTHAHEHGWDHNTVGLHLTAARAFDPDIWRTRPMWPVNLAPYENASRGFREAIGALQCGSWARRGSWPETHSVRLLGGWDSKQWEFFDGTAWVPWRPDAADALAPDWDSSMGTQDGFRRYVSEVS